MRVAALVWWRICYATKDAGAMQQKMLADVRLAMSGLPLKDGVIGRQLVDS